MDYQSNGITGSAGLDVGYNNYNSSGVKEDTYVSRGNEGSRELQQIPVGKAFRGEVTDVVGNRVHIRLDNGQSVQAKMEEPISLNIGDKLLFQIKSNNGGMIEIKPLVNAAAQGQEMTILKALEAANLPVNEKTVALLQSLLKEQMPIDRSSLFQMYRQVLANGNADINTIVQMNKSQIPVTQENIGQFEAYKNYEHRIASEAEQLSSQLMDLLAETSGGNGQAGDSFHLTLLNMFAGKAGQDLQPGENPVPMQPDGGNTDMQLGGEKAVMTQQPSMPGQPLAAPGQTQEGQILSQISGQSGQEQAALVQEQAALVQEQAVSGDKELPKQFFTQEQIGYELSVEERQSLLESVRELPLSEELKGQILNGEARIDEILKQLNIQLQQFTQFAQQGLLHNKSYQKILRSQIKNQWFIRPEQLSDGYKMDEFYQKLQTQAKELEQMLNQMGKGGSQAARTAEGMKNNIDFMNQINQMFTYVQIPLMMSGKTAHSDLYVFTKKKNLRQQEGRVSALLHLDMEALGSLDVYVEMDGMDIHTKFKLADQELVNLFEEHMDFLAERITQKGYRFDAKVDISEQPVDFVEDFLQRDHGSMSMHRFAFDVRA